MTTSAKDSASQGCRESYGCAGCGVREGIHKDLPLSPVMVSDPQIGWPSQYTGEHLCPLCIDKLLNTNIIMSWGRGEPVKFEKAPLFPFGPGKQKRDWIVADLKEAQRILTIKKEQDEKRKAYEIEMRKGMVNAVPRYDEPLPAMPEFSHAEPPVGYEPIQTADRIDVGRVNRSEQEVWIGTKAEIKEFLKAFEHAYGYNRDFAGLLNEMARTHIRKNRDYAEDRNRYSNFEYACRVAEPFTGIDKVFATMIGIKMARMGELKKGKTPNFESLADSHLDECVYSTLWASYTRMKEREDEKRRGDKTAEG